MAAKNQVACLHILPTFDTLELIVMDSKSGEIELATSMPAPFNPNTRQIDDPGTMQEVVKDLYTANKIPLKTPTILVVPSFFTREVPLPADLSDEELQLTLVSEAERFFLFKKTEPVVGWITLEPKTVLYAAYPKTQLERFAQIFQEQRTPLLAVDLNYFSIYRGLIATGALQDEIKTQEKVCVLVLTDFSFFAMLAQGVTIEKTLEAPLSVVGSEIQDIVSDIQQDYESFIGFDSISKTILVNNTTRLPSETLSTRLGHQNQLMLIEQNVSTLRSWGAANGQFPCSLEAIGGSFYRQLPEFPRINLIPDMGDDFGSLMVMREQLQKWLWIANGGVFALGLIILGFMMLFVWLKQNELDQLRQSNQATINNIMASKSDDLKRKLFAKGMEETNVKLNDLVVKLGALVPDSLWLQSVKLEKPEKDRRSYIIEIKGNALNPDGVNQLRNQLNSALKRTDLDVSKIDLAAGATDSQQYYDWIIQTKVLPDPAAPTGPGTQPPGRG